MSDRTPEEMSVRRLKRPLPTARILFPESQECGSLESEQDEPRTPSGAGTGTDGATGSAVVARGKIRISPAKHWCFTYHNPEEAGIEKLLARFQGSKATLGGRWVFQEEFGKLDGPRETYHLQGYVEFEKKIRPLSLGLCKEIYWKKTKKIAESIIYCSDPMKRCEFYRNESGPAAGRIWKHRLSIPRTIEIMKKSDMYVWQQWIADLADTQPDQRTIYWFWEPVGGVGKSSLVRWLVYHQDAVVCAGKSGDIKYMVNVRVQRDRASPRVIVFDVPRSKLGYLSHTGIEEVKNACFGSSKYECETVLAAFSHVFIFANARPDFTQMSMDRWQVGEIVHNSIVWDTGIDRIPDPTWSSFGTG